MIAIRYPFTMVNFGGTLFYFLSWREIEAGFRDKTLKGIEAHCGLCREILPKG